MGKVVVVRRGCEDFGSKAMVLTTAQINIPLSSNIFARARASTRATDRVEWTPPSSLEQWAKLQRHRAIHQTPVTSPL